METTKVGGLLLDIAISSTNVRQRTLKPLAIRIFS